MKDLRWFNRHSLTDFQYPTLELLLYVIICNHCTDINPLSIQSMFLCSPIHETDICKLRISVIMHDTENPYREWPFQTSETVHLPPSLASSTASMLDYLIHIHIRIYFFRLPLSAIIFLKYTLKVLCVYICVYRKTVF